jgi:adenylylsulfate kinase
LADIVNLHIDPIRETPMPDSEPHARTENIVWHQGHLTHAERCRLLKARGCTLWFTGLSGSGKSTIAAALEAELVRRGIFAYRLDGDNIRHGLNAGLGFSAADREENIRRVGEVARLFADAGVVAIASFISPYRADRARVRALHAAAGVPFVEVFIDTPLEVCEARDPKGLYKKARAGEIQGFTGIDDPYEAPEGAEVRVATSAGSVGNAVELLVKRLVDLGLLQRE